MSYDRDDLVGKTVGFILISFKSGKFLPRVAQPIDSDGDNDAFLNIVGEQPAKSTYEEALACFDGDGSKGLDHVFRHPVSTNTMGMTWLSELTKAEAKPLVLTHRERAA